MEAVLNLLSRLESMLPLLGQRELEGLSLYPDNLARLVDQVERALSNVQEKED